MADSLLMTEAAILRRRKWQEIISQQRGGGMTAAAFCREHHVSQAAFYRWSRRLADPATALAPAFIEAKTADIRSTTCKLQIALRGGRRLIVRSGFDHELLAEVVTILEGLR